MDKIAVLNRIVVTLYAMQLVGVDTLHRVAVENRYHLCAAVQLRIIRI